MAQITEDTCRRIIEDTERGYSTGLTQWERCQLAWTWLKANGHEVPETISINFSGTAVGKTESEVTK